MQETWKRGSNFSLWCKTPDLLSSNPLIQINKTKNPEWTRTYLLQGSKPLPFDALRHLEARHLGYKFVQKTNTKYRHARYIKTGSLVSCGWMIDNTIENDGNTWKCLVGAVRSCWQWFQQHFKSQEVRFNSRQHYINDTVVTFYH